MRKLIFLLLMIVLVTGTSMGATHSVFNVTQFQNALTTAESNNEDDTIIVASGNYNIISTLTYNSVNDENYSLTIAGAGADSTIIDGGWDGVVSSGTGVRVLEIHTTDAADDSTADIVISGITIRNAESNGAGLSIKKNAGNVTVRDCNILNNIGSGEAGIAIWINTACNNLNFIRNVVRGNISDGAGGGGYLSCSGTSSALNIENNMIQNNKAEYAGGIGVEIHGGSLNFLKNIVVGNYSDSYEAGGLEIEIFYSSAGTIAENVFIENGAATSGGGAFIDVSYNSTVNFTNNTIYGNSSVDEGGGVYFTVGPDSAAYLFNNISWNNFASAGSDIYIWDWRVTSTATLAYNNYSDFANYGTGTVTESNKINLNPVFVNTSGADPTAWDLHLQSTSPCIDAGDNSAPGISTYDIDGDTRSQDGDGDGTSTIDIGADEFVIIETDGGGSGSGVGADGGGGGCFVSDLI